MPASRLPACIADASALVAMHGAGSCPFSGHGGDGNGHVNGVAPEGAAPAGDTSWLAREVSRRRSDLAAALGGAFGAFGAHTASAS